MNHPRTMRGVASRIGRWSHSVQTLARGYGGAMRKPWCVPLTIPFLSLSLSRRFHSSYLCRRGVHKLLPGPRRGRRKNAPLPHAALAGAGNGWGEKEGVVRRWEGRVVKTHLPSCPFPSQRAFPPPPPYNHCIAQPSCRCAPFYPPISAEESTFLQGGTRRTPGIAVPCKILILLGVFIPHPDPFYSCTFWHLDSLKNRGTKDEENRDGKCLSRFLR